MPYYPAQPVTAASTAQEGAEAPHYQILAVYAPWFSSAQGGRADSQTIELMKDKTNTRRKVSNPGLKCYLPWKAGKRQLWETDFKRVKARHSSPGKLMLRPVKSQDLNSIMRIQVWWV